MEEEDPQHDPLLKPGAFIDPYPRSISKPNSKPKLSPRTPKPDLKTNPKTLPDSGPESGFGPGPAPAETPPSARPDWLPPSWTYVERVRTSGATAGTRDKYFFDPVTNRRFRSKKEVFAYLESGGVPLNKRNANSDANATAPKRKKDEPAVREITEYFNVDDVPAKIKWELTDVSEGGWTPLINGVERVSESSKQDWLAAFTYLASQNSGT